MEGGGEKEMWDAMSEQEREMMKATKEAAWAQVMAARKIAEGKESGRFSKSTMDGFLSDGFLCD